MNKALIGVVIGALTAGGASRVLGKPKKTAADRIVKVLENPSVITGIFGLLATIVTVKYGKPAKQPQTVQPTQPVKRPQTIDVEGSVCDG